MGQIKVVEFDIFSGHFEQLEKYLNRALGQYKQNYTKIKIGITGNEPQLRFEQHLNEYDWNRMIVKYITESIKKLIQIQSKLIEKYEDLFINDFGKTGDYKINPDNFYLYFLLGN